MLKRLSLNSFWLLVSRLVAQLGLALFTVLLARALGSSGFGQYAFMASLVVVGNVLTTFGTDMLLIREIAAHSDLSGLAPALLVQLVLSLLFIGGVFVYAAADFPAGAQLALALRIYSLSLLPLAFFTVFTTALRGRQHMLAYSLLNMAVMLVQVLAAYQVLRLHAGLPQLARVLVVVQLGAALLAGAFCLHRIPGFLGAWRPIPAAILPLLRASLPIALLGLLGVIYQRLSILLLPGLAGAAAAGWFSAAARLVEAAKLGHVAVLTAIYPMLAQRRQDAGSEWARPFRLPALALLASAVAASALLFVLARWLVPLLFGAGYLPSIAPVRILAWALVPYSVNSFLSLAMLARHQESRLAWALALGILVLLLLSLWWVPLAGPQGAAWAVVCAESAQAVCLLLMDLRGAGILASLARAGQA